MLIAKNKTGSPLVLTGGFATIPSTGDKVMNITFELRSLSNGQYAALDAQRLAGSVDFYWIGPPLYTTTGLTVGSSDAAAAQADATTAITNAATAQSSANASALKGKWLAAMVATIHMKDHTSTPLGSAPAVALSALAAMAGVGDQTATNTQANAIKKWMNAHFAEGTGAYNVDAAHAIADSANAIATADASDSTTCIALIVALKLKAIAHASQSGVHFHSDAGGLGTLAISPDPPVTLANMRTALDSILAALKLHVALASF